MRRRRARNLFDRPDERARACLATSGDIERAAMRNRRKQNRRTDGKGGRPVEPEQLRGNMALIVIHHDIGIETLV